MIGLFAKAGRGGGTYAHRDIAFEFGSWLSPEFKLYLITAFRRLKDEEARASSLEWSFQRTLAKVNCRNHTDAIKEHRVPRQLTKAQTAAPYASEVGLLDVALFGMTAAEWREANPSAVGNMQDAATCDNLVMVPDGDTRVRCLRVCEKGERERFIPLRDELLRLLEAHRLDRERLIVEGVLRACEPASLIGVLAEPLRGGANPATGVLSASGVHRVLKAFFVRAADHACDEHVANDLLRASAH